jgi:hypothetical protein
MTLVSERYLRFLTDRVLSGQPVSSGWPFFGRFYELSGLIGSPSSCSFIVSPFLKDIINLWPSIFGSNKNAGSLKGSSLFSSNIGEKNIVVSPKLILSMRAEFV